MATVQSAANKMVEKSKSVHRGAQVGATPVQKRTSAEAQSPGQAAGVVKQVLRGPTYKK